MRPVTVALVIRRPTVFVDVTFVKRLSFTPPVDKTATKVAVPGVVARLCPLLARTALAPRDGDGRVAPRLLRALRPDGTRLADIVFLILDETPRPPSPCDAGPRPPVERPFGQTGVNPTLLEITIFSRPRQTVPA